jgi:hypothetical protein
MVSLASFRKLHHEIRLKCEQIEVRWSNLVQILGLRKASLIFLLFNSLDPIPLRQSVLFVNLVKENIRLMNLFIAFEFLDWF